VAAIAILYFASMREAVGLASEMLEQLPEGVSTARDLIAHLVGRGESHALAFAEPEKIKCAIDQEMAALDTSIIGAREIAFFPPVTGG
jgi:sulfur-carrier protein